VLVTSPNRQNKNKKMKMKKNKNKKKKWGNGEEDGKVAKNKAVMRPSKNTILFTWEQ